MARRRDRRRFGPGPYLLDEPEAALSATGALALVAIMVRAARRGARPHGPRRRG